MWFQEKKRERSPTSPDEVGEQKKKKKDKGAEDSAVKSDKKKKKKTTEGGESEKKKKKKKVKEDEWKLCRRFSWSGYYICSTLSTTHVFTFSSQLSAGPIYMFARLLRAFPGLQEVRPCLVLLLRQQWVNSFACYWECTACGKTFLLVQNHGGLPSK